MDRACQYVPSVIRFYTRGLYQDAIDLAKLGLAEAEDHGRLWELLGMAHQAAGENAEACHALEMATMLVPLSAAGQCVLARAYIACDHVEIADSILRYLLTMENLPPRLLPAIAVGFGAIGECANAMEACRRASLAGVDDGQPLFGMAHYMERLGYPVEFIAPVLRRAVEREPQVFHYRFALANAHYRLGQQHLAYRTLAVVSDEELGRVRCGNCLKRMCAIFQSQSDHYLVELCVRRLQSLAGPDAEGRDDAH